MKKRLIGGLIGAIPGIIMLILTGPLDGEIELTLGMLGILSIMVGFFAGMLILGKPSKKRT